MHIITRKEAAAQNLVRYFTGKPCKYNHVSERYIKTGGCVECGRERSRKWVRENLEKHRVRARNRRRLNPEKVRAYERKARGLPEPTRPQPKLCECCGNPPSGKRETLSLDHCHETGRFRGWLCIECNSGIGMLGDNLSGMLKAIKYLEKNQ